MIKTSIGPWECPRRILYMDVVAVAGNSRDAEEAGPREARLERAVIRKPEA